MDIPPATKQYTPNIERLGRQLIGRFDPFELAAAAATPSSRENGAVTARGRFSHSSEFDQTVKVLGSSKAAQFEGLIEAFEYVASLSPERRAEIRTEYEQEQALAERERRASAEELAEAETEMVAA